MQQQTQPLLRISEVARQAHLSLTTVKYYAREGLIEPSCKTSPNMAYYAPSCVERVRLIKTLQSEKFYPLAVIRRIVQSGGVDETQLLETINKADAADYYETVPFPVAVREAGLRPHEAEFLVQAGVLTPTQKGRTRTCRKGDLRVMALAKQRLDAGIPLAQTATVFCMYDQHLRDATRLDIESLITAGLLGHAARTEQITRMITVSDETLDSFIEGRRYAYNAALGAEYLDQMAAVSAALLQYGRRLHALLLQSGIQITNPDDEVIACYTDLTHLQGKPIAQSLAALSRAATLLCAPPVPTQDAQLNTVRQALRLSWRTLAPAAFGYDRAQALSDFLACATDPELAKLALEALKS